MDVVLGNDCGTLGCYSLIVCGNDDIRRIPQISGHPYGSLHSEESRVRHAELYLGLLSGRSEYSYVSVDILRSYEGYPFLACKLAHLGKFLHRCELVSLSEERLYIIFSEMHVSRGGFHQYLYVLLIHGAGHSLDYRSLRLNFLNSLTLIFGYYVVYYLSYQIFVDLSHFQPSPPSARTSRYIM